MESFKIIAEPQYEGKRIDVFLAEVTDNSLSRTYIQKLLESEQVFLNNRPEKIKKYKIKTGDEIEIFIPEPQTLNLEAQDIPLDIVYEDSHVAVINKPRGMVVHPAPGNEKDTMVNAILYHCKELSSIGGVIRPGIVHRIDKDTTGLIMIAKNDLAHISLSEQLKVHSITRVYNAIVHANIKNDEGTIDYPIGRNPNNRFKMAVSPDGRRAVTHYKVLERFGDFTFIEARLETGRTHQIRVHMSYIKHPLLGDAVYGPQKNRLNVKHQMLHAKVLGFVHPSTGEYMEFSCDLPDDFLHVLDKLRKKNNL